MSETGYLNPNNEDELLDLWESAPNLSQDFGEGVHTSGECLKCSMRNHLEEIYSNDDIFQFSKAIADRLTGGKSPRTIPTRLLNCLIYQNDFSEEHVKHVSNIRQPGIVAMGAVSQNGLPTLIAFLIDGTHRAVASVRAGRDFQAYILTAKETAICAQETRAMLSNNLSIFIDPSPKVAA